jgi:diguanylate cyclase (GGDEF)-like protein
VLALTSARGLSKALRRRPRVRESIDALPSSPPPRDAPSTPAAPAAARVLVVDDEPVVREFVARALGLSGFDVETVGTAEAALARVAGGGIDLVLLDVMMPGLSGLDACHELKARTADTFLPVILVTARTDTASRVEGLRAGADDYVGKPFDRAEFVARVDALLRIKRRHDGVAARLEREGGLDDLTGLRNARFLEERLAEEFRRAERYHEPFACVVTDVDDARAPDDTVVRAVADALRRAVRDVDVVARTRGAEFLVLLPSTHFAGAMTVAERLARDVTETVVGPAGRVSLSIGVALYPSRDVRTKEALVGAAREALAHAKSAGGSRIAVFQQPGASYVPAVGAPRRSGSLPPSPRSVSPFAGTRAAGASPRSRS